jgi:hypothetical protein
MSTPTLAELQAEVERLKAKLASKNRIWFKVGEKGGVSAYGINSRFPVTLYGEQWERLIGAIPELKAFMVEHKAELTTKQ